MKKAMTILLVFCFMMNSSQVITRASESEETCKVDNSERIDIEDVAEDLGVSSTVVFDVFNTLPEHLNKIESLPVQYKNTNYDDTSMEQTLELENGLRIVKETELKSIATNGEARYSSKLLKVTYSLKDPLGASTGAILSTNLSYDQNMYSYNRFDQRITGIAGSSSGCCVYSISYGSLLPDSSKVFSESPYAKQYYYAYFVYNGSPWHKTITNTIKFTYAGTYSSTWE